MNTMISWSSIVKKKNIQLTALQSQNPGKFTFSLLQSSELYNISNINFCSHYIHVQHISDVLAQEHTR